MAIKFSNSIGKRIPTPFNTCSPSRSINPPQNYCLQIMDKLIKKFDISSGISFYLFLFLFYCLCYYSCSSFIFPFPTSTYSTLSSPSVNTHIVGHVHGSSINVLWLIPSPSFILSHHLLPGSFYYYFICWFVVFIKFYV